MKKLNKGLTPRDKAVQYATSLFGTMQDIKSVSWVAIVNAFEFGYKCGRNDTRKATTRNTRSKK